MSRPCTHLPPWFFLIVVSSLNASLTLPLAQRRDNWIGWIALVFGIVNLTVFFGTVIVLAGRAIVAWYRDRPRDEDTADALGCYQGQIHELRWDEKRFTMLRFGGDAVVDVPLHRLLDVIDTDAIFLDDAVTINTGPGQFTFHNSRRERAKLMSLIKTLTQTDSEVREEIRHRRRGFIRRGLQSLPISLVLFVVMMPPIAFRFLPFSEEPQGFLGFFFEGLFGFLYGILWLGVGVWAIRSVCCLMAARKLNSFLEESP